MFIFWNYFHKKNSVKATVNDNLKLQYLMYKYKAKLLMKAIRIFAFLQTKSFGDLALLFSWNIILLTNFKHFSLIDVFTWSNWEQYMFELIICIIIFVWYWYLYSSAEHVIPGYSPLIAKHDHQYLQSQISHLY